MASLQQLYIYMYNCHEIKLTCLSSTINNTQESILLFLSTVMFLYHKFSYLQTYDIKYCKMHLGFICCLVSFLIYRLDCNVSFLILFVWAFLASRTFIWRLLLWCTANGNQFVDIVSCYLKWKVKLNLWCKWKYWQACNTVQEGANPSTCREVLLSDHYAACHNLVLYYQMVSLCFCSE